METRYCRNCGAQLSETAQFCSRCGAKVTSLAKRATIVDRPEGVRAKENSQAEVLRTVQAPALQDDGLEVIEVGEPEPVKRAVLRERKRSWLFTAFLAAALVANLVVGMATVLVALLVLEELELLYPLSALLNLAAVVFLVAALFGKRWGAIGYLGVLAVTLLANLVTERFVMAALALIPILILLFFFRRMTRTK